LEVTEGDFEGRRAWCDFWLTAAALPMTKRDLAKIGVTDLAQLEQPLPVGILIRGKLALRCDDDGNESNRLTRFECAGIEPGDAFEPTDADAGQGEPNPGNAIEPAFPFGGGATTGESAASAPSSNGKPPADANGAAPPSTNGEPPAGSNGAPPKPKRKKKVTTAPGTAFGPTMGDAGQADAKPPQTDGTPAGELFPHDAADKGGASDFLAHERGAGK
jgi:hypothetical protein